MRYAKLLCLTLVVACAKKDDQAKAPADSAAADFHGTWKMEAKREGSDSVVARYTLWAQGDSVWKMLFDGRNDTLPVHVIAVGGDSIVTHVPTYNSALRKNVKVETFSVYHLQNGELDGKSVAHYKVNTPDSVVNINTHGTRAQ